MLIRLENNNARITFNLSETFGYNLNYSKATESAFNISYSAYPSIELGNGMSTYIYDFLKQQTDKNAINIINDYLNSNENLWRVLIEICPEKYLHAHLLRLPKIS